jgi:hypothetical protein
MKKLIVILLILLCVNSFAQKTWADYGLTTFNETLGGKTLMGLKDKEGKVVLKPFYAYIDQKFNGGYTTIANPKDKRLTDAQIEEKVKENTLELYMGLIDSTGKTAIEPNQYYVVKYFHNSYGLAYIYLNNKVGMYSLINKRVEMPIEYDEAQIFLGQMPYITVAKSKKVGLYGIDEKKLIVPCLYDRNVHVLFHNRYKKDRKTLGFTVSTDNPHHEGLLDATGKVLLGLDYFMVTENYTDENYLLGKIAYETGNKNVHKYGYFRLNHKSNDFRKGELQFDKMTTNHKYPTALVLLDGKWGLIDCITDKYILDLEYTKAFSFADTIIAFSNDKQGGIYHLSGKPIVPIGMYDSFKEYQLKEKAVYSVQKNNKWGYIDMAGNQILPIEFDREVAYKDTMWVVKKGKWDCITPNNKSIIKIPLDTTYVKKAPKYIRKRETAYRPYYYYLRFPNFDYSIYEPGKKSMFENSIEVRNAVRIKDKQKLYIYLESSKPNIRAEALFEALKVKDTTFISMILKFKPDLTQTENVWTYGNISLLNTLLYNSAPENVKPFNSEVLLKLTRKFLDLKMDINGKSGSLDVTPLMLYLVNNDADMQVVEMLIKAGATVSLKDNNGKDALYYAKKAPKEVVKYLKDCKKNEI